MKDFCHNYQIPFLENNISKSCKQAAKIYYRLMEDRRDESQFAARYQPVIEHLKSIPQEDIDEAFNPFKMREKWMKFFRSGFQRVLVDTDRALKNDMSDSLKAFISDQKLTFTDKQFIRALLILSRATGDFKATREKDRVMNFLLGNILAGKFEFKKGNTIASLAESLMANFETFYPNALDRPQYDVFTKLSPPVGGSTDVMQMGIFTMPCDAYYRTVKVFATKLSPFLRNYYFGALNEKTGQIDSIGGRDQAHKKAVVVAFLGRMRIYDDLLFANFTRQLG